MLQAIILITLCLQGSAFLTPTRRCLTGRFTLIVTNPMRRILTPSLFAEDDGNQDGIFENRIPEELRAEIYRAEGNTAAAQGRTLRIVGYIALGLFLLFIAFANAFFTELRQEVDVDTLELAGEAVASTQTKTFSMDELGYGWVESNPVTRFFLMGKVGGGFSVLAGPFLVVLAEQEWQSRQKNAEAIFDELMRRRNASRKEEEKEIPPVDEGISSKKRKSKTFKRINALAEVVKAETQEVEIDVPKAPKEEDPTPTTEKYSTKKDEGVFATVKDFYNQADKMAAAQALLLNKELEDRGVVDKITDETGLKVIGKEAAKKVQEDKTDVDETQNK